jgi:hypothetical protein
MYKKILLASFVYPRRIEWFLNHLEIEFNIKRENVFIFEYLNDDSKRIVTFKFNLNVKNNVNLKELFPNTILIHKRGTAIYTINALNELIKKENLNKLGNIDFKSIKVDWCKYQDNILLYNNSELNISPIKRIL